MLPHHHSPAVASVLGGVASKSLPPALAGVASPSSTERAVDLAIEALRMSTLNQIAFQAIRPAFVLSGGSGSGKSHMCKLLKDAGYIQAERLITRPRRPCDPVHDRSFPDEIGYKNDPVALSYSKHASHYGVPLRALQGLNSKEERPIFIAGDVGKITPFSRLLDLAFPLLPVVNIRLEVPVAVMAERLARHRVEGFQGEALQRQKQNEVLLSWEQAQTRALKEFFNMHVVLNLTASEHETLGYTETQLKPLDRNLIKSLLPRFEQEAVARSSVLARDIIRTRSLNGIQDVPSEVLEVLQHNIAPALSRSGVDDFAIKGGLAVALYLAPQNVSKWTEFECSDSLPVAVRNLMPSKAIHRPVSPDIDWAVGSPPQEREAHGDLIRLLTGQTVEWKDFWEKPIFNSNKAHATISTTSGGTVELDAIALSRVRPPGCPFCFEFPFDGYLSFRRREVQLSEHQTASLVPPEMLIMEKLIAGRGCELGKFDLFDAVAVLCTQPLDLQTITHMVESQEFAANVDRSTLPGEPTSWPEVAPALRECGIRNKQLFFALIDRCVVNYEAFQGRSAHVDTKGIDSPNREQQQSPKSVINFEWTPSTIKRMAFVDAALSSLDACLEKISNGDGEELASLVDAFGRDNVRQRVLYLHKFLMYLGSFQIGRPDVYISSAAFAASVPEASFGQ